MKSNQFIFSFIFFLAIISCLNGISNEESYKEWQYAVPISVTDTSGQDLTEFQVKVTINTEELVASGKLQINCEDIRFVNDKDQTLSFWIQNGCKTDKTLIWIKIPQIKSKSTTKIYLLYGNPDAKSASYVEDTLLLYDDFSGENLDRKKWLWTLGTNGKITQEQGFVQLYSQGQTTEITSIKKISLPAIVETEFYTMAAENIGDVYIDTFNGETITSQVYYSHIVKNWFIRSLSGDEKIYGSEQGVGWEEGWWSSKHILLPDSSSVSIKNEKGEKVFSTTATATNDKTGSISIKVWITPNLGKRIMSRTRYILVRSYASSDPLVGIGKEETYVSAAQKEAMKVTPTVIPNTTINPMLFDAEKEKGNRKEQIISFLKEKLPVIISGNRLVVAGLLALLILIIGFLSTGGWRDNDYSDISKTIPVMSGAVKPDYNTTTAADKGILQQLRVNRDSTSKNTHKIPIPKTNVDYVEISGQEIIVRRGMERAGQYIKIAIKVENPTNYIVTNVKVSLDVPDALVFVEPTISLVELGNIEPHTFHSANFKLKPEGKCVDGLISGVVLFHDHRNQSHSQQVRPLKVTNICPMLEPEDVSYEDFVELMQSGKLQCRKVYLEFDGSTIHAFNIAKSRVHSLILIEEDGQQEKGLITSYACYYGKTKYNKNTFVIEIFACGDNEHGQLTLIVYSDEPGILTGFFAEVQQDVERALHIIDEKAVENAITCSCGAPVNIKACDEKGYHCCDYCGVVCRLAKWNRE